MNDDRSVLMTEDRFFAALSKGDREALGSVVADDCVLIDVMTGSEVPRAAFVESVGSRRLVFESIERLARLRARPRWLPPRQRPGDAGRDGRPVTETSHGGFI